MSTASGGNAKTHLHLAAWLEQDICGGLMPSLDNNCPYGLFGFD